MLTKTRARSRPLSLIAALCAGALVLYLVLGGGGQRPPGGCRNQAGQAVIANGTETALRRAIEHVPCVASGRVSYDTKDDKGDQMAALDPIDDPAGGYLAVYHSPFGSPAGATSAEFRVSLAHSTDLIHWRRVRVLDPGGANMPTLRAVPGRPGYLLAYEKAQGPEVNHFIRIRYYHSLRDVLADRIAAQVDLPRRFSRYSNGTPSFFSIDFHGGLRRSIIRLGFHYETASRIGEPGPDREALGTLRGFRFWTARRDTDVDELIDRQGFRGSHGDRRQFSFGGRLWRLYEARTVPAGFADWHVLLYDLALRQMQPLELVTPTGTYSSSFGSPIAGVLRAPGADGHVMAITMFVFSAGEAATRPGELLYYRPIAGSAISPARTGR